MIDIEKVSMNTTAKSLRLIDASPESLRECADRLENQMRSTAPGESILCELTQNIHVVFKPPKVTGDWFNFKNEDNHEEQ